MISPVVSKLSYGQLEYWFCSLRRSLTPILVCLYVYPFRRLDGSQLLGITLDAAPCKAIGAIEPISSLLKVLPLFNQLSQPTKQKKNIFFLLIVPCPKAGVLGLIALVMLISLAALIVLTALVTLAALVVLVSRPRRGSWRVTEYFFFAYCALSQGRCLRPHCTCRAHFASCTHCTDCTCYTCCTCRARFKA